MNQYEPIFNLECVECESEPCVGIREAESGVLRCTQLCGGCFFGDRSMRDWEVWNLPQEATE